MEFYDVNYLQCCKYEGTWIKEMEVNKAFFSGHLWVWDYGDFIPLYTF